MRGYTAVCAGIKPAETWPYPPHSTHGMRNVHTCSTCHGMQCALFSRVEQLYETLMDGCVPRHDLYDMHMSMVVAAVWAGCKRGGMHVAKTCNVAI